YPLRLRQRTSSEDPLRESQDANSVLYRSALSTLSERFEASEHFFGFSESFQWNAIADCKELVPHREHVWIFVRSSDRFVRFPFRHFDDRAVARPHDRWLPIGHQTFIAQSRHATPHELEQVLFFSRLRSIRHDHNYAVIHLIDVALLRGRD